MHSDADDAGGRTDTVANGLDFDLGALPELQRALEGLEVTTATVRWPEPKGPAVLRVEFASEGDRDVQADTIVRTIQSGRNAGGARTVRAAPAPPRTMATGTEARPVFTSLTVDAAGADAVVEVTLAGGRTVIGRAEGLDTGVDVRRTAATATVAAVQELLGDEVRVGLRRLELVVPATPGRAPTLECVVVLLTGAGEEELTGAALVRDDPTAAAVRATLDAINRRIDLPATTSVE